MKRKEGQRAGPIIKDIGLSPVLVRCQNETFSPKVCSLPFFVVISNHCFRRGFTFPSRYSLYEFQFNKRYTTAALEKSSQTKSEWYTPSGIHFDTKKKGHYRSSLHGNMVFLHFSKFLKHFDEHKMHIPHNCPQKTRPWNEIRFLNKKLLNRHYRTQSKKYEEMPPSQIGCDKHCNRVHILNRHIKNVRRNERLRLTKKYYIGKNK
ncbi:hypothetical protein KDRO_D01320 [Kluyveromyces lactis]|nr:hypothetical protein KDRO_D01320 [Kluyveromyces lactis]